MQTAPTDKYGARGGGLLDGKIVIVTGASSGIGRETALAAADEGANVAAVARNGERLALLSEEMGDRGHGAFITVECDVTDEAAVYRMAEEVLSRFGRIDALVASAGVGKSPSSKSVFPVETARLPLKEWEDVIRVNLTGVFLSNRAVLPAMKKQRSGTIVNISSHPAGIKGQPYAPAYSASKFGVVGFTEALCEEVRPHGIKVHVVLPGLTDTPMTSGTALGARMGKALSPGTVADLIVYLLSLPEDTLIVKPQLVPFQTRKRKVV